MSKRGRKHVLSIHDKCVTSGHDKRAISSLNAPAPQSVNCTFDVDAICASGPLFSYLSEGVEITIHASAFHGSNEKKLDDANDKEADKWFVDKQHTIYGCACLSEPFCRTHGSPSPPPATLSTHSPDFGLKWKVLSAKPEFDGMSEFKNAWLASELLKGKLSFDEDAPKEFDRLQLTKSSYVKVADGSDIYFVPAPETIFLGEVSSCRKEDIKDAKHYKLEMQFKRSWVRHSGSCDGRFNGFIETWKGGNSGGKLMHVVIRPFHHMGDILGLRVMLPCCVSRTAEAFDDSKAEDENRTSQQQSELVACTVMPSMSMKDEFVARVDNAVNRDMRNLKVRVKPIESKDATGTVTGIQLAVTTVEDKRSAAGEILEQERLPCGTRVILLLDQTLQLATVAKEQTVDLSAARHTLELGSNRTIAADLNSCNHARVSLGDVVLDTPLGRAWKLVGQQRPQHGKELHNLALADAITLQKKQVQASMHMREIPAPWFLLIEFTQQDLDAFHVHGLDNGSFIRAGEDYFLPADGVTVYETMRMEHCHFLQTNGRKVEDAITGNTLDVKEQTINISTKNDRAASGAGLTIAKGQEADVEQLARAFSRPRRHRVFGVPDKFNPVLVRAAPGTGKTWMVQKLVFELSGICPLDVMQHDGVGLVPVLIYVQRLARFVREAPKKHPDKWPERPKPSDFLELYLKAEYTNNAKRVAMILTAFQLQACIMLVDGIDEAGSASQDVMDFVLDILTSSGNRLLTTSRPVAIDLKQKRWNTFDVYDLCELTTQQARRLPSNPCPPKDAIIISHDALTIIRSVRTRSISRLAI